MNLTLKPSALEIRCFVIDEMAQWYAQVLNALPVYKDSIQIWLKSSVGWYLQFTVGNAESSKREAAGLKGLSLQVESHIALKELYLRMKRMNIHPQRAVSNGFVTTLSYLDPEGNSLHFRYILPESLNLSKYLDPLGEDFDPERVFSDSL